MAVLSDCTSASELTRIPAPKNFFGAFQSPRCRWLVSCVAVFSQPPGGGIWQGVGGWGRPPAQGFEARENPASVAGFPDHQAALRTRTCVVRCRSLPKKAAPSAFALANHLRAIPARRNSVAVAFEDFFRHPSYDGGGGLGRLNPLGKLRFKLFKIRHKSFEVADNVRPLGVAL